MLVLGRRKDESIEIDVPPSDRQRTIRVSVCAIKFGYMVRIGVDADKDVVVLRSELKEVPHADENRGEG